MAKDPGIGKKVMVTIIGEKRSEMVKKEKHRVPIINPSWTAEVIKPKELGLIDH